MSQEERERRGFHGAAWRRRTADHARVQRTLAVLIALLSSGDRSDAPAEDGWNAQTAGLSGGEPGGFPPAQVRGRTRGEEAQLGMSLEAGPGGENGSQDPRRFPPSFHGGNWTCCLINPTSVGAHIADLKTLPADFLFLPEVSLTAGAQRHATKELALGERGFSTV